MRVLRQAGTILVLVTVACSYVSATESPSFDPALLRQRLVDSVGTLPWKPDSGYTLEGRFILKAPQLVRSSVFPTEAANMRAVRFLIGLRAEPPPTV